MPPVIWINGTSLHVLLKFPIKISWFFSLEMQLSLSAYSPVPKVMSYLTFFIVNTNAHTNIYQCHFFRNCYCPCRIAIQIRNMLLFIWCMFHHLLVTLLSTFFVQTEIYISRSILVELHKWYPNYSWAFQELHNQPWCCSILLQVMKKKLCGFRFLMEMEPGLEPFS